MKKHVAINARRRHGFTLLEVLIAMLIFSFGLLGLAALQTYSVKANQSANFRSQASALANTMLDNIRANRTQIANYYSNGYNAAADCPATPTQTGAAQDLALWRQQLACQLPQGVGAVAPVANSANEVAVCIRWSDSRLQQGAVSGTTCTGDITKFKAGSTGAGPGAGTDGESSVFIVATRL